MLGYAIYRPSVLQSNFYFVPFFAHQVLTFSVFCGIIGIVHSDDPFELMFGYSILLQIRYYGYLFLKTLYCNFILQCAESILEPTASVGKPESL